MYQEGKGLQQYHGKPSFNQKPESMVEKYWELIVAEKETIQATGKVKTHMIVSIFQVGHLSMIFSYGDH